MDLPVSPTPREFGGLLREAREAAGVALEDLAGHTKLSRRMLESLEEGAFGVLPDQIFVKLFLRQYLDFIGVREAGPWERAFAAAWERSQRSSQSFVVAPAREARSRRLRPWILTALLVGATVLVLWKLESGSRRPEPPEVLAAVPTTVPAPAAVIDEATPAPTPQAAPAQDPQAVTVVTTTGACWVQVRFHDGRVAERLVPSGTTWSTDESGRVDEIILGNAVGVTVRYADQTYSGLGTRGEVVHIRPTAPAEPA